MERVKIKATVNVTCVYNNKLHIFNPNVTKICYNKPIFQDVNTTNKNESGTQITRDNNNILIKFDEMSTIYEQEKSKYGQQMIKNFVDKWIELHNLDSGQRQHIIDEIENDDFGLYTGADHDNDSEEKNKSQDSCEESFEIEEEPENEIFISLGNKTKNVNENDQNDNKCNDNTNTQDSSIRTVTIHGSISHQSQQFMKENVKKTVKELREQCKKLGLQVGGNKNTLLQRLSQYYSNISE